MTDRPALVQQLLLIEIVSKLSAGLLLMALPRATARLMGLPVPDLSLWPRLVGALLVGIAAATFIELRLPGSKGLSLAGLIAINLFVAAGLFVALVLRSGAPTRRGRVALWLLFGLLVLASLFEIAQA
ncbi:MAG: ABC transporter permease [Hyphomicrobiaceae bacterium]